MDRSAARNAARQRHAQLELGPGLDRATRRATSGKCARRWWPAWPSRWPCSWRGILGSLGGSGGAARADPLAALASTSPAVGVLIQVRACVHVLGKGGLACAVSWPSPGLRQLPGVGASVAHVRIAVGSAACETELQGCCLHLSTLWY